MAYTGAAGPERFESGGKDNVALRANFLLDCDRGRGIWVWRHLGCFCRHREDPVRSLPGCVLGHVSHGCCPPSITASKGATCWARRFIPPGFFAFSVQTPRLHSHVNYAFLTFRKPLEVNDFAVDEFWHETCSQ